MLFPHILYEGDGGIIVHMGRTIGRIGAWKVQIYGDDHPFFTASTCDIPQFWCSAGLVRLVARPLPVARPRSKPRQLIITGDVAVLSRDRLSLRHLTIEGAD